MSESVKLNRRAFVAAQAGIVALGATGLAHGSTSARWDTATAKDLTKFIGDSFTVKSDCGLTMKLTLDEAIASKSGWARPANLRRREGVLAVFKTAQSGEFAKGGDRMVQIQHKDLGQCDVFLAATPKRNGGYHIEAVLN